MMAGRSREAGTDMKENGSIQTGTIAEEYSADRLYAFKEVRIRLGEGQALYSASPMDSPRNAVEIMRDEMAKFDREVLCVVNLNSKIQPVSFSMNDPDLKPINYNIVSVGNISTSIADIANVLKSCILSNAASFLILHNHPSGDITPSREDILTTQKVILAGAMMGIPCLDHIIIGANRKEYFSMREHGTADFSPSAEEAVKGVSSMVAEPGAMYQSSFGEISPSEFEDSLQGTREHSEPRDEISLHFGKKLCTFFTSRAGKEMARIKIPGTEYPSWPEFVVPAKMVHDNQYGKGFWIKLPANGKTRLSYSERTDLPNGERNYERKEVTVTNRELKEMVESYRHQDRDQAQGAPSRQAMVQGQAQSYQRPHGR